MIKNYTRSCMKPWDQVGEREMSWLYWTDFFWPSEWPRGQWQSPPPCYHQGHWVPGFESALKLRLYWQLSEWPLEHYLISPSSVPGFQHRAHDTTYQSWEWNEVTHPVPCTCLAAHTCHKNPHSSTLCLSKTRMDATSWNFWRAKTTKVPWHLSVIINLVLNKCHKHIYLFCPQKFIFKSSLNLENSGTKPRVLYTDGWPVKANGSQLWLRAHAPPGLHYSAGATPGLNHLCLIASSPPDCQNAYRPWFCSYAPELIPNHNSVWRVGKESWSLNNVFSPWANYLGKREGTEERRGGRRGSLSLHI